MKCIVFFLAILASPLSAASFDFNLLPSDGAISGTAGSTIGWGYSITNPSSAEWLVLSGLNVAPFLAATPNILFDFPTLKPGSTITESYDSLAGKGLLELLLSNSIGSTVVNSGEFELTAEWWSGDPFAGGSFVADADAVRASYQATDTASGTPEPGGAVLALSGVGVLAGGLFVRSRVRKTV